MSAAARIDLLPPTTQRKWSDMTNLKIPVGPPAHDIVIDVLVIGSGTGLAAALAAAEKGLSVLVVEKTALVGGSTARSGGAFWIPGNPTLREAGACTSRGAAQIYVDDLVGEDSPRERSRAFLDHGPEAVSMLGRMTRLKFFWSKGYSDYEAERPGGSNLGRTCESLPFDLNTLGPERHRFRPSATKMPLPLPMPFTGADYRWINLMTVKPVKAASVIFKRLFQGVGGALIGRRYVAGGQAIAAGMFEGAIRANIPIWTRTKVVELLTEGGRVTGAVVDQEGGLSHITATRGVILAAGGFDHNMPMRRMYQSPSLVEDFSLGAEGNTGDAIDLGLQLGANLRLMSESWWFPAVRPASPGSTPGILLAERSLPGSLIVDQSGKRFVDEAVGYMTFGQEVLRREREGSPVGQMWLIFDQTYRNRYLFAASVFPRASIPEAWFDAGVAFKADTPAALARAVGIPEDQLTQTLARFNVQAGVGIDTEFRRGEPAYDRYYGDPSVRPNPNLRALTGDLYAIKLVLSDLGTCGGLAADESARVLRADGSSIPGLYAIGNCAANAFGRTYPGAGATIGQGITFGYIAVQHIVADSPRNSSEELSVQVA